MHKKFSLSPLGNELEEVELEKSRIYANPVSEFK